MQIQKLNSSFHGGISSFSLFLLLYAYLISINNFGFYTSNSTGKILYEFLECYSNFNFGIFCIDVSSQNPFILLRELNETGMLILEPFTHLNVAKSSFKVDEIKSCFCRAFNIIYQYINYNNNDDSEKVSFNIINDIFKNKYI
jgi:DNA polymerase sigma